MAPGRLDHDTFRRTGLRPGMKVKVRFLGRLRDATFLEDRGPLSYDGGHIYRIVLRGEDAEERAFEIPADRVRLPGS